MATKVGYWLCDCGEETEILSQKTQGVVVLWYRCNCGRTEIITALWTHDERCVVKRLDEAKILEDLGGKWFADAEGVFRNPTTAARFWWNGQEFTGSVPDFIRRDYETQNS